MPIRSCSWAPSPAPSSSDVDGMKKVMERFEVGEVLNLGSLMDAVPHTRDAMLSAGANKEALKERLQGFRIRRGAPIKAPSVLPPCS